MSFWEELKRRNVVRVGIAYAVAAWIILQLTDVVGEIMELPPWGGKLILLMVVVGFFIALFLAWAFELTPEGIKREAEVDRSGSIAPQTGRKLDRMITGLLVLGLAYFVWESRFMDRQGNALPPPDTLTGEPPGAEAPVTAATPTARNANSIAVLPFVNMSNDPDQDYFSDGISEELLNLLARVEGLDVASRTSSFAFKDSRQGIPQIAEELRVANVLEGSVRKAGNQVRITAQLIDTNNDRNLWSDSFDRDLNDIFQVQDEIASAIVDALKSELGLDIQDSAIEVRAVTADMDAYDLYLKGRELTLGRRELREAVSLLEQSVSRDPNFARAWAMLGMANYVLPGWLPMSKAEVSESIAAALDASNRALALDESLAMPWAIRAMSLGQVEGNDMDYGRSIDLLTRAIDADRNNATAWLWRGIRHSEAGYIDAAIADAKACLDIDPAYQNCRRHLAIMQWIYGNASEAMSLYTEMARSGFTVNDAVFVPLFFENGQPLAGYVALSFFAAQFPGYPANAHAEALVEAGAVNPALYEQALAWLDEVGSLPAGIHTHMLVALRAYEALEVEPNFVNNFLWHPPYDHFRKSPHFQRLIRDMNLPAYWAKRGLPEHCKLENDQYRCLSPAAYRRGRVAGSGPAGDGT